MRRFKLIAALALTMLAIGSAWNTQAQTQGPQSAPWPAEAFHLQWQRTDALVAQGGVGYSWYWGPAPRTPAMLERDDESPGGKRLVQYYDKGRMELPTRLASGLGAYQLTFGRLVAEMVSGNVQLGARRYEAGRAAQFPVAGDADDPLAPTYATFAGLLAPAPAAIGARPGQSIDRSGQLRARPELAVAYGETANARYDAVLGHNIPRVFVDFMARSGPVNTLAGRRNEPLADALALVGRPIAEAYWADVQMSERVQPVLVQLFERRVLTYNPANPPAFRVEMGNVGLHYYEWRYGAIAPRSDRREELLDHFEGNGQALNGNYWFSFDDHPDGGNSSASSGLIGPGALDSVHAMRLNYSLSNATPVSYAALALNLDHNGTARDLRGVSAVGFWARGNDARFTLMVNTGLSDEPLAATFAASANWAWVEVPLDTLRQSPGKEVDRGQALANATRIQFRPADKPSSGFLDVDDLVLITGTSQPTVQDNGLPLIDNFDDGNLTTALNTEWFTYDDRDEGGGSAGELALVSPGANGSRSALRFRGAFNNQWGGEPFVGMGAPLAPNGQTFDMSDYKAIRISIKPDSHRYRLQINSALIKGRNQYGITLDAPEGQWNTLYVPLKLLAPIDARTEQPIDLKLACTQLTNIVITPLDKPEAFQLFIDDVSLVR